MNHALLAMDFFVYFVVCLQVLILLKVRVFVTLLLLVQFYIRTFFTFRVLKPEIRAVIIFQFLLRA